MVPTGSGDLESPPSKQLTANRREINRGLIDRLRRRTPEAIGHNRLGDSSDDCLSQRTDTTDIATCQCSLHRAIRRDDTAQATLPGNDPGRE
jgi:hypothetical protein